MESTGPSSGTAEAVISTGGEERATTSPPGITPAERVGGLSRVALHLWAFAVPPHGRLMRFFTSYIVLSLFLIAVGGWLALAQGLESLEGFTGLLAGIVGAFAIFAGVVMSRFYHRQYPGRFNPWLSEYAGRRVSRLEKRKFVPEITVSDAAQRKAIAALSSLAESSLRTEIIRMERNSAGSRHLFGLLIVGERLTSKTEALWTAMASQLGGWAFVQWAHHMDHPPALVKSLGYRVVVWLDDLHDYANPGEAAALVEFVAQLQESRRQVIVLATCGKDTEWEQAQQFFRPMMQQLYRIDTDQTLIHAQTLADLEATYAKLDITRQSIVNVMHWLKRRRVATYPFEVLGSLLPVFARGQADPAKSLDTVLAELSGDGFVRVEQPPNAKARLDLDPVRPPRGWLLRLNRQPSEVARVAVPVKVFYLADPLAHRAPTPAAVPATPATPPGPSDPASQPPAAAEATSAEASTTVTPDAPASGAPASAAVTPRLLPTDNAAVDFSLTEVITNLKKNDGAVETLVLLGYYYLSTLNEQVSAADEVKRKALPSDGIEHANARAMECFVAALSLLRPGTPEPHLRGVWAAATLGKGTAELNDGKYPEAGDSFASIITLPDHPKVRTSAIMLARAWHGRGDARHAEARTSREEPHMELMLMHAAEFYAMAAHTLEKVYPKHVRELEPLWAESMLDRATALFDRANRLAARAGGAPSAQEAMAAIVLAKGAYRDALRGYPQAVAPGVWAEIQRCLGALYVHEATLCLPISTRLPAPDGGTPESPLANREKVTVLAKKACNHFNAARTVFTASYMPSSWARSQLGIARALLLIAVTSPSQKWADYKLCMDATSAAEQVFNSADRPRDWVALQLVRAEIAIRGARSDGPGVASHYAGASNVLTDARSMLEKVTAFPGSRYAEEFTQQRKRVEELLTALGRTRNNQ